MSDRPSATDPVRLTNEFGDCLHGVASQLVVAGVAGDGRLSKAAWLAGMFETIATRMPRCQALQYFGRVMTGREGDYTPDTSGADSQALATLKVELVDWR